MSRVTFLAVLLAIGASACSNDTTTPTTPTTAVTVTDTFAGPLTQNSGATHSFSTAASGNVSALITNLSPTSSIIVGLSLGTWNGASCSIVLVNDKATQTSSLLGTASGSGTLCVRVYDVGNITEPITYEVQVTHP